MRRTFKNFKKEILEHELNDEIIKKRKFVEKHKSASSQRELTKLEKKLDDVNLAIEESLKGEFSEYWNELASLCFNWGCKIKMNVS